MCMTDPISDMLTRIRNALAIKKNSVIIPFSKLNKAIIDLLLREGYIKAVEKDFLNNHEVLVVSLKYYSGAPVIERIKRISKPGCRVYSGVRSLKTVNNGLGTLVLSTSAGIMSDAEAREKKLGGEKLFEVF